MSTKRAKTEGNKAPDRTLLRSGPIRMKKLGEHEFADEFFLIEPPQLRTSDDLIAFVGRLRSWADMAGNAANAEVSSESARADLQELLVAILCDLDSGLGVVETALAHGYVRPAVSGSDDYADVLLRGLIPAIEPRDSSSGKGLGATETRALLTRLVSLREVAA